MRHIYEKKLSSQQLMYAAAVFIIASNLLTKNLYQYTENQSWVAIIIATLAGLLLVTIYGKLISRHRGKNCYDINEWVFGTAGGMFVSGLYVFYFLTLTVLNTRELGSFVTMFVLPATPLNMIYAFFLLICTYAVKKGADKMTRYGTLIFCVYSILLLFITVLQIPNMDLRNFEPIFTVPLKNQLIGAHLITMMPLGEVFVFLVMTQHMAKPDAMGKALRRGLLIGAAFIMILDMRSTAVMGDFTKWSSSPIFSSIRLVNIGDILTRLEIINSVLQMILLFFKTSILFYGTVTGFAKLFNLKQYDKFTLIFGVLVLICANFFFQNSAEHTMWFNAAATYATFFLLILPVLTLAVSVIRGRKASAPEAISK